VLQAPAAAPKPIAPSFDIVRVNPRGDVVVAGRAEPNATVSILDGETPLGTVKADGRGEWVWVPSDVLAPGSHSLSLRSQLPGRDEVKSEAAVVVVVPERDRDIAGQPTTTPDKPLAMMVPREGAGATAVLQAPAPPAATPPAAAAPAQPQVGPAPSPAPSQPVVARTGPAGPVLSIEALDYDQRGRVSFSGRTEPEGRLFAYIDNKIAGQTAGDARGGWKLTPEQELGVGAHQLRVDLVGDQGKVLARVELIFYRAAMMADASQADPALAKPGSIVIQPGNNLWRIARHTYGAGIQYTHIFEANREQIRDPNLIYPGQVFSLPPAN
jgi:nucleoid-associated protein YgaU